MSYKDTDYTIMITLMCWPCQNGWILVLKLTLLVEL